MRAATTCRSSSTIRASPRGQRQPRRWRRRRAAHGAANTNANIGGVTTTSKRRALVNRPQDRLRWLVQHVTNPLKGVFGNSRFSFVPRFATWAVYALAGNPPIPCVLNHNDFLGGCDYAPMLDHRVRSSCWGAAGKCASWPAGAPGMVRAGESTTVPGAEVIASPVTTICPIMKGCGVQV
jgi:hypothetical protein